MRIEKEPGPNRGKKLLMHKMSYRKRNPPEMKKRLLLIFRLDIETSLCWFASKCSANLVSGTKIKFSNEPKFKELQESGIFRSVYFYFFFSSFLLL